MNLTSDQIAVLRRPNVARGLFVEVEFPSETRRYHNGAGNVTIGGYEWFGVTDPVSGQMVSINAIEEPRFGQAASLGIVLSGIRAEFMREIYTLATDLEGLRADVYFVAFDTETLDIAIPLKKLFPGFLSSPKNHWQAIGERYVSLTIESTWQAQNYPFSERWTNADQQRRYTGDLGLSLLGVTVNETTK